jgi:hypothetical protein
MGVHYSLPSAMLMGTPSGIFYPGRRCPDVYLHIAKSHDETQRMYAHVQYGKFIVLVRRDLANGALPFLGSMRQYVELWMIGGASQSSDSLKGNRCFDQITEDGEHMSVDIADDAIVIRPDMYVGCSGRPELAREYLAGIFTHT